MENQKLVVKDNALINASYKLDLVEQRLVLLAVVEARESGKGITANEPLTIHASNYIQTFNVEKHTAYTVLKSASEALFNRQFSYQEARANGVANITSRWVSQIGYIENTAIIELIFSPAVVPLITRLEKEFTKYDLQQISGLSSGYAVRLYELLIQWRSNGKTPLFELTELRNKLGVSENEFSRMEALKRRVLDLAIKQINDYTDISAEYEQHKRGRTITGFSFTFKQKNLAKKPEAAKRGRKPKVSNKVATPSEMDTPALPPKQRKKPEHSAADMLKTALVKQ